jgi:pyruvate, orthophosphate dikinase
MRALGKAIVVGMKDIVYDDMKKELKSIDGDVVVGEGDIVSVDGATGLLYKGEVPLIRLGLTEDCSRILTWADKYKSLNVFGEACNATEVKTCTELGADGIGMCRIDSILRDPEIRTSFRKFIVNEKKDLHNDEKQFLIHFIHNQLFEMMKLIKDNHLMIELVDSPFQELFPSVLEDDFDSKVHQLAGMLEMNEDKLQRTIRNVQQVNSTMGNRGARLLLLNPGLLDLLLESIIGAAIQGKINELNVHMTILIPYIFSDKELSALMQVINKKKQDMSHEFAIDPQSLMIEIGAILSTPRSCLRADAIASMKDVDVICLDTDSLTQLSYGISENDCYSFLVLLLSFCIYSSLLI